MSRRYASETTVSTEKSRAEIESLLRRYGADQFSSGWRGNSAGVQFSYRGRLIQFVLELPDRADPAFRLTPSRRFKLSPEASAKAWEQACRQRWRALALVIKAKLEAIEVGIATFEQEFLPFTVLPDGRTVSEWLEPQIESLISTGKMPKMLGIGGAA